MSLASNKSFPLVSKSKKLRISPIQNSHSTRETTSCWNFRKTQRVRVTSSSFSKSDQPRKIQKAGKRLYPGISARARSESITGCTWPRDTRARALVAARSPISRAGTCCLVRNPKTSGKQAAACGLVALLQVNSFIQPNQPKARLHARDTPTPMIFLSFLFFIMRLSWL